MDNRSENQFAPDSLMLPIETKDVEGFYEREGLNKKLEETLERSNVKAKLEYKVNQFKEGLSENHIFVFENLKLQIKSAILRQAMAELLRGEISNLPERISVFLEDEVCIIAIIDKCFSVAIDINEINEMPDCGILQ